MKKISLLLVVCLCLLFGFGCGNTSSSSEDSNNNDIQQEQQRDSEKLDITKMTAEEIVNVFVESGLPITKIIVYDEETDENELLGRPNQYTSKVNFADDRAEQFDIEVNPVGGSVEVFNNKDDAKARHDYLDGIGKSSSLFAQYLYLYDNVLLRIDYNLTPSQAEQYEKAFISLQNGEMPESINQNDEEDQND